MDARVSLLAIPVLIAAAAGCSSSSSSIHAAAGTAQPDKEVSITVDRLTLTIPANAVTEPTKIQIEIRKVWCPTNPVIGSAYVVLPTATTFALDATLSIRSGSIKLPEGVTEDQLFLATLGPTGLATPIPGSTVDVDAHVASAPITTLGTFALLAPPSAPPDNGAGSVVFLRPGMEGIPDLWSAASDGSGAALVLAHTPGETMAGPRLAAGAPRIAFAETVGGFPEFRAWIVNLDGSGKQLVTSDAGAELPGDFNAGATRLYVSRRAPGAAFFDLAVYDLTSGPPFPRTMLTNTTDESETDPRLSPDGTTLLFLDSLSELLRMSPTSGSEVKFVTKQPVVSFAWRPDGERVIVERGATLGGGLFELNPTSNYSGLGLLKGSNGAKRPSYSPNGEQVLFELFDTDPAVAASTLRQISRKGATGSILLGGAVTVFPGSAPACAP